MISFVDADTTTHFSVKSRRAFKFFVTFLLLIINIASNASGPLYDKLHIHLERNTHELEKFIKETQEKVRSGSLHVPDAELCDKHLGHLLQCVQGVHARYLVSKNGYKNKFSTSLAIQNLFSTSIAIQFVTSLTVSQFDFLSQFNFIGCKQIEGTGVSLSSMKEMTRPYTTNKSLDVDRINADMEHFSEMTFNALVDQTDGSPADIEQSLKMGNTIQTSILKSLNAYIDFVNLTPEKIDLLTKSFDREKKHLRDLTQTCNKMREMLDDENILVEDSAKYKENLIKLQEHLSELNQNLPAIPTIDALASLQYHLNAAATHLDRTFNATSGALRFTQFNFVELKEQFSTQFQLEKSEMFKGDTKPFDLFMQKRQKAGEANNALLQAVEGSVASFDIGKKYTTLDQAGRKKLIDTYKSAQNDLGSCIKFVNELDLSVKNDMLPAENKKAVGENLTKLKQYAISLQKKYSSRIDLLAINELIFSTSEILSYITSTFTGEKAKITPFEDGKIRQKLAESNKTLDEAIQLNLNNAENSSLSSIVNNFETAKKANAQLFKKMSTDIDDFGLTDANKSFRSWDDGYISAAGKAVLSKKSLAILAAGHTGITVGEFFFPELFDPVLAKIPVLNRVYLGTSLQPAGVPTAAQSRVLQRQGYRVVDNTGIYWHRPSAYNERLNEFAHNIAYSKYTTTTMGATFVLNTVAPEQLKFQKKLTEWSERLDKWRKDRRGKSYKERKSNAAEQHPDEFETAQNANDDSLTAELENAVTLDKIIMDDNKRDELKSIVKFIVQPNLFAGNKVELSRGILLLGEPGVGKTYLASAMMWSLLKEAHDTGVDTKFIHALIDLSQLNKPELLLRYYAEHKMKAVNENKQCIFYIDEIDKNLPQSLSQLLLRLMSGASEHWGMANTDLWIASTNHPEKLDPALLRKGRLGTHILLNRPTGDILKQAWTRQLRRHLPSLHSLDIKYICDLTEGHITFQGIADVVNAAVFATQTNSQSPEITQHLLENKIDSVLFNKEATSALPTEVRKRIASHVAAHTLVSSILSGTEFLITTIDILSSVNLANKQTVNTCSQHGHIHTKTSGKLSIASSPKLDMDMQIGLAGVAADRALDGGRSFGYAVAHPYSEQTAREIAFRIVSNDRSPEALSTQLRTKFEGDAEALVETALNKTTSLLNEPDNKKRLIALRDALLTKEKLTRNEILEIIDPQQQRQRRALKNLTLDSQETPQVLGTTEPPMEADRIQIPTS